VKYTSSDIDGTQAMVAADITALPFDDDSFDVVLCSHVLEHVEGEQQALAEIQRVLKPGGWAALMVPVDRTVATTLEDPSATTQQQRLERFGQIDHVRLYGRDVAQRLGADEVIDPLGRFGPEREARYGLRRQDRFGPDEIYLLRTPS
jgi:ubiquinone/menaquinone biosynthesis C-methylase UbiE